MLIQICENYRANYSGMTIQHFGSLFKTFDIYPITMVKGFLHSYAVKQDIKICDLTWHSFISEIVTRFEGAGNHSVLLDFLEKVAEDGYLRDKRQQEFVMDLMKLNVPKLFAKKEEADETASREDTRVARAFQDFLASYINRNALKKIIIIEMMVSSVSLDCMTGLHRQYLNTT